MSFSEREYERQEGGGRGALGGLGALFTGSIPLGTWFGIRVRVHASLLWFMGLTILLTPGALEGFGLVDALTSMGILFGIILLHEFGHCFAARSVGGSAEDILLWPLGGLAYANSPHRPWPTFVTVAGGPLVNVIICLITGVGLAILTGKMVPLNPLHPMPPIEFGLTNAAYYMWWVFSISYILLLFNLLPVYPLDGGQLLQTILWPRMGYARSMELSCLTGMIGAGTLGLFGLIFFQLMLMLLAVSLFMYCYQKRMIIREMGPEMLEDAVDYSTSLRETEHHHRKHHKFSRRARRKIQKRAMKEQQEQARIDAILEKVSAHGLKSLNWCERRALRKATERQRQADVETTYRHV